jgi:polysaccharide chain length determinant protein (PEP-CTERM system associated)
VPAQKTPAPAELHPLSLIRMLWKRKLIIGLIWIAGTAVAVAVVWKLPPVYKSEALILVDSQKIPERFVSATVSTDIQDRIATISQQIMSSSQLKKIMDDFGLYKAQRAASTEEEVLDAMRKDITISMEKGWTGNRPGAFRVGYQGPDPQIVAQVANRLANLYIEENLRVREVQAQGTSEFMDTQLVEAKKRLDQLEAAVSEYKVRHNGELPEQENAITSELTREDLALQASREAVRHAEESKSILRSTLGIAEAAVTSLHQSRQVRTDGVAAPAQTTSLQNTPQLVSESHAKVLKFRAKLEALHEMGYADRHPDILAAQQELAAALTEEITEAAAAQKKSSAPSPSGKPETTHTAPVAIAAADRELLSAQERVAAIKTQIDSLDRDIRDRDAEQKIIKQSIQSLQTRLAGLPVREQEMAGLTRDYEISKANYRNLLDKKLSAEMATDMERRQKSERFTLLDPPRVPEKPAKPNRPLFGGIGSALALALGLILGLGIEFRDGCVLGEWELPKGTVILGRVPHIELVAKRSSTGLPKRTLRRWAVGIASVVLVAAIVTGFYFVRSNF